MNAEETGLRVLDLLRQVDELRAENEAYRRSNLLLNDEKFPPAIMAELREEIESFRWLLAEARWFAEEAADAEGVIQARGYDNRSQFPWEKTPDGEQA